MSSESNSNNTEYVTYSVLIRTDDADSEAGTVSDVFIEMVGATGDSTGWIELKNLDDYDRGDVSVFNLSAINVGLPLIVRIKLGHDSHMDEWLVSIISVTLGDQKADFPIYDWIEDFVELTRGEGMLPQRITSKEVRKLCEEEKARNKIIFAWCDTPEEGDIAWGLNRILGCREYDELPQFFKRDELRNNQLQSSRYSALAFSLMQRLASYLFPLKHVDDYHRLYKTHNLPHAKPNATKDWNTDEGMGELVLNGISPHGFYRCYEIPDGFDVTNGDVTHALRTGRTLEEEMQAGRIYVGDYNKLLSGVGRNKDGNGEQLFCANAIGMFYVREDKRFVPIAMQLVPGDRNYLFTSRDEYHDWLLAKMYYRCAEGNYHQWVVHFLRTHGVTETVAISMFRCLPRCHPIYKLLRPHLKFVAAINIDARQNLLPPSGKANKALAISATELARKSYKTFHFEDLVIPKYLKKLGLDDPDLLPNYYYREDALALWEIMGRFVTGVLRLYYKTDQDVVDDYELQEMIRDFALEGIAWQDGDTRGVPDHLDDFETLHTICLTVMYTSSVQHAAVNFGQFDTYKYVPSAPGGMMLPPHAKGEGSMKRIVSSLPGTRTCGVYVAFGYILSQFSDCEIFLGNYPQRLFSEEAVIECQRTYQQELKVFSEKVKARNANLENPYIYLLPERIPNGCSI